MERSDKGRFRHYGKQENVKRLHLRMLHWEGRSQTEKTYHEGSKCIRKIA